MSKAEHTPGTWRVSILESHTKWGVATDWDDSWFIADVFDLPDPHAAEANARLISAAPDLLAACKAMIEAAENDHPAKRNVARCDALNMMDRAIAKAEGKGVTP